MASPLFEQGVSCPHCHNERTPAQRQRYAERQRQIQLAKQRGEAHLGAQPPREDAHKVDQGEGK
jgi:UPF0176 protein